MVETVSVLLHQQRSQTLLTIQDYIFTARMTIKLSKIALFRAIIILLLTITIKRSTTNSLITIHVLQLRVITIHNFHRLTTTLHLCTILILHRLLVLIHITIVGQLPLMTTTITRQTIIIATEVINSIILCLYHQITSTMAKSLIIEEAATNIRCLTMVREDPR
jgi:hypothetical protein